MSPAGSSAWGPVRVQASNAAAAAFAAGSGGGGGGGGGCSATTRFVQNLVQRRTMVCLKHQTFP